VDDCAASTLITADCRSSTVAGVVAEMAYWPGGRFSMRKRPSASVTATLFSWLSEIEASTTATGCPLGPASGATSSQNAGVSWLPQSAAVGPGGHVCSSTMPCTSTSGEPQPQDST